MENDDEGDQVDVANHGRDGGGGYGRTKREKMRIPNYGTTFSVSTTTTHTHTKRKRDKTN
ncbi:hypothetical protein RDWZM_002893 [Blomia tropicalis]|uniref:Uncharacterized protein n=1 Tax=Blomia tropicalis TaxID=40697 RepID=A0A9Q0RQB7_BLOTA|nr:hypothetical protein RDWZM_002893 [Blomia tropicalis]